MNKLVAAVATTAMLGIAGSAFAGEPVQLTNRQMDHISAGGIGGVNVALNAMAAGALAEATQSHDRAAAFQTPNPAPLPSTLHVLVFGFNRAAN